MLCDTWLRSLVKNLRTQPRLMTAAEAEEAQRLREERKKLKEEKRALKDKEGEAAGGGTKSEAAKKKAKAKANKAAKAATDLLTAEERMNEFMSKFR